MNSCFDATTLVASPSYPNSISWSDDNLLAVASGHIITILNPAALDGPRELITLNSTEPLPIGVVSKDDLITPCLIPTCLTRDTNPTVQSISWSPAGFASNSGCLLAVCTIDGRVRLYRSPFLEFRSEWVQVADLSHNLYDYLASVNFGESRIEITLHEQEPATSCAKDKTGKRKRKSVKIWEINKDQQCDEDLSPKRATKKFKNKEANSNSNPKILPNQYFSRSKQLSSLTVSWSPSFQTLNSNSNFKNSNLSRKCAILAIGAKSGEISFWRIFSPQNYSIVESRVSDDFKLIGILKAHDSFISSINWGFFMAKNKLILATGSSDGSLKLWSADSEELSHTTEIKKLPFSFLTEVTAVLNPPVSIIKLIIPLKYQDKVLLATGRGSGSVESYIYDLYNNKLINGGSHSLNYVVTGLEWGFDGRCLYSCSQDSVRCFILHENHLHEVPFSSNIPGLDDSSDLSHLSDQYFGLALSPGEMMLSLVHSLDTNLLNPMYQARTQKAMVQFFYTGGQILQITKEPSDALLCWESNILFSLKNYENREKTLVISDIIKVLLAFKNSNPTFLNNLCTKWLSTWFPNSQKDILNASNNLLDNILSHIIKRVSNINTRKLNMLNIIIRCVILNNSKNEEKELEIFQKVLVRSEFELRERLVCLTFDRVLKRFNGSCFTGTVPYRFGLGQMVRWVLESNGQVSDSTKKLALNVEQFGSSVQSGFEFKSEEKCSYCSSPVQFKNSEFAWCNGPSPHKLLRCAVSMQICSVLKPPWFCVCCERNVDKLPPKDLFSTCENLSSVVSFDGDELFVAICPFCGVMLQRRMPEFFLSLSPV
ncbi:hypothetical protein LUZ60_002884 [Juncus effusus]|nr:hypothetical protein LUZ60_002884 [Juncus effusus]